jgi:hypothetical protein
MTAIPAALGAANDEEAIALMLERYRAHSLTPAEVEKDLLLLFDAEIHPARRNQLKEYITDISNKVASGELESEDAASDVRQMIGYWVSQSEDLSELLELGSD